MSTTTTTTEWPEGVIARYRTVGLASADVIDDTTRSRTGALHVLRATCTGERCPAEQRGGSYSIRANDEPDEDFLRNVARLQEWAQTHAEKCRAMPRPV